MDQVDVAAPLEEPLGQIEDVAPDATPAGLGDHQHLDRPTAPGRCDLKARVRPREDGRLGAGPVGRAVGGEAGNQRKTVAHRYPPGWNENGFKAATPHSPAPGRRWGGPARSTVLRPRTRSRRRSHNAG